MKTLFTVLLVVSVAGASQALIIGDFEGGSLDNWNVNAWGNSGSVANSQVPGTVTLNESSLALMDTTTYWGIGWNSTQPAGPITGISFDLTMIASEWPADMWTQVADKVHVQGGGMTVTEFANPVVVDRDTDEPVSKDWGNWGGTAPDAKKSYFIDMSSANYVGDGSGWMQIQISVQSSPGGGNFYFDNIELIPEPGTLALIGLGGLLAVWRRRR